MEYLDGINAVKHLQTRASCRGFTDQEVTGEQLDLLLEAALHAASGGNLQPWSVIVERDKERNARLAEINAKQKFMEQAPINLIFLLDWHKMATYAKQKSAPFLCNKVYMHYLIGLEDVLCAAQTVETAAHLLGLGSCYVGTCNWVGDQLVEMYDLPQMTYPVVILSVGHPKAELKIARKLERDIMVFEGRYPKLDDKAVFDSYEKKYGDMAMPLPKAEPHRSQLLDQYKKALETTFGPEEVQALLDQADKDGAINEIQRRFGLHYHAADRYAEGARIIQMMADQDILPFDAAAKE